MCAERTLSKETARVLSEAEMSTRYWFTGNKECWESKAKNRYLYLSFLHAAIEELSEPLKSCGRISIKIKL